jgi:hypothetical protein
MITAFAADQEKDFTFGKPDLDLLEQSDLLDKKLERDGVVLHDEAVNAYAGNSSEQPSGRAASSRCRRSSSRRLNSVAESV